MGVIIDLYHQDDILSIDKFCSSTDFVIHKLSQGYKLDSMVINRVANFEKRKLPYWLYIFLNNGDEIGQIDFAIRQIKSIVKENDYLIGIVIDVEDNNPKLSITNATKYIKDYAYSHHLKYGLYLGYSNKDKYKDAINIVKDDSRGFIWMARYTRTYTVPDYVDLWQYTESGTVDTMRGKENMDLNKIMGTRHKLAWYQKQYSPKKETPTEKHVLSVAEKEVGYIEKASASHEYAQKDNKGSKNYTKYGNWIGCDGDYWCASFISWLFYRTYGTTQGKKILGNYSPACNVLKEEFKLHSTPKVGDIVFFSGTRHSGANHVGIVYEVTKTKFRTIEGNANPTTGVTDNGGSVCKKEYNIGYDRVLGFGTPNYAKLYDGKLPTKFPSKGYFYNGCPKSGDVKLVEQFLQWYFGESNCKDLTVDGVYGDITEKYVRMFQKNVGLEVNGQFGKNTLAKAKEVRRY